MSDETPDPNACRTCGRRSCVEAKAAHGDMHIHQVATTSNACPACRQYVDCIAHTIDWQAFAARLVEEQAALKRELNQAINALHGESAARVKLAMEAAARVWAEIMTAPMDRAVAYVAVLVESGYAPCSLADRCTLAVLRAFGIVR